MLNGKPSIYTVDSGKWSQW